MYKNLYFFELIFPHSFVWSIIIFSPGLILNFLISINKKDFSISIIFSPDEMESFCFFSLFGGYSKQHPNKYPILLSSLVFRKTFEKLSWLLTSIWKTFPAGKFCEILFPSKSLLSQIEILLYHFVFHNNFPIKMHGHVSCFFLLKISVFHRFYNIILLQWFSY